MSEKHRLRQSNEQPGPLAGAGCVYEGVCQDAKMNVVYSVQHWRGEYKHEKSTKAHKAVPLGFHGEKDGGFSRGKVRADEPG
jgi:hypothetical protein